MRMIIIGGVAAGMSAAAKLRREDATAEIIVYERTGQVSYGACGLPYFVAGYNDDWHKLVARTAAAFEASGIMVRLYHEVLQVLPEQKQIRVRQVLTGEETVDRYDRLLIATGANPVRPPFPGVELPGVHTLKTIDDAIALKDDAMRPEVRDVVIIGGGYIGIETLEAMVALGKTVRCIEAGQQILMPFEPEIAQLGADEIKRHNAALHLNEKVTAIHSRHDRLCCIETDLGTYQADLVIVAVGVKPVTAFLAGSGVALAMNGAIIVDREMRTSVRDVFAAGDCAEVYHRVLEENAYIPLGTTANKCGRMVAANMLDNHQEFIGTLGSASIKVLDMELARTGLSERDCQRLGIAFQSTVVKVPDHPAYYPDQTPIHFKLIVDPKTHRLLGAHGGGAKGAVLRIDIFAVAIHNGMTSDELGQVDLCYSPPFAGVWDAVLVASNAVK